MSYDVDVDAWQQLHSTAKYQHNHLHLLHLQ
jgi:hypothetical protein